MKRLFLLVLVLVFAPCLSFADSSMLLAVSDLALRIPLQGMSIEDFLNRSVLYTPKDIVRDGLPHFGAWRDDWMGKPRKHRGIDIYADKIDVVACADGIVEKIFTGRTAGGYVKIRHARGIKTLYMHLTGFTVRPGQKVQAGQVIGRIDGLSGNNYEPQLHFELQIDGEKVDPIRYVKETYAGLPGGEKIVSLIDQAEKELPEKIEKRKKAVIRHREDRKSK